MEERTPQSHPDDAIEDTMVSSSPDSGLGGDLDLRSPTKRESPCDLDSKSPNERENSCDLDSRSPKEESPCDLDSRSPKKESSCDLDCKSPTKLDNPCDLDPPKKESPCDPDSKSPNKRESPCDQDSKSPKLLDPLLHDRRLTLLKSLSQDSEYSLDTSLFDAEDFLQDMGFAGGRDPTIPDRFLPSLMQRLARFPESEMESLHDRIIQSIGCFRRKEGKRRLFRNLSMGKDPRRGYLLGCPAPSHPLLRSNTDPSSFPYEETSSAGTSSSSLLQSSSSPESPIAILVSAASVDQDQRDVIGDQDQRDVIGDQDRREVIGDQDQMDASRDQDQYEVSRDLDNVSAAHDESDVSGGQDGTSLADAASQADIDAGDEFASTVEGIRKLTKEISVQDDDDISQLDNDQPDDDVSQSYDDDDNDSFLDEDLPQLDNEESKPDNNVFSGFDADDVSQPDEPEYEPECDVSQPDEPEYEPECDVSLLDNDVFQTDVKSNLNQLFVENNQTTVYNENNHLSEARRVGLSDESSSFTFSESGDTHNFNNVKLINSNVLNKDLSYVASINGNVSETQINNNTFSNTKTPLRRISNAIFYNPKSLKSFGNFKCKKDVDDGDSEITVKENFRSGSGQYSIESEDSNAKLDELEKALNGTTMFNESVKLNGGSESISPQNESSINTSSFQTNQFSKPKYSRGDSLTHFLSSMLDTRDGASNKPSITVPSTNSEKTCNSDSEMAGSFASSPFILFGASDTKSKSHSCESPQIIQTNFSPLKNLKVKESNEKAPNRKRRVLRRMSSSLQCCDDVNCNDSNGLKLDCLSSDVDKSAKNPFVEANPLRKLNIESFRPVSSNHRVVHSCSSLPVSNLCRACNNRCKNDEINENTINCQTQISRNCCGNCDSKRKKNMSCFRKCKRRRNLSCPSPELSWNHSGWFKPKPIQCDCMIFKNTPNCIENNRHKSLVLPSSLSQKETYCSCRCLNESSNCRLNLCCVSSQSDIFHSPNTEICDSNVRCLGPPSPSLLQPNANVFAFGPNLWNQNRSLCYSSPDLSQECCGNQFEHCRSFTNVDERSFNSFEKCGPQSFRGDTNCTDEVFFKDFPSSCSFFHSQCPDYERGATKSKLSVRTPQRQNSISIKDSEVTTHNSTSDNNNLPVSFSSNKTVVAKEPLSFSSTPNVCSAKDNRINDPSTPYVPKAFHLPESPSNNLTSVPKPPLTPSKLIAEEANEILPKSPTSPATKSEALLERKIRIFSKFLANLGNLSKSVTDTDVDSKHKRITRDQKSSDVPSPDKKAKPRVPKVSCPAAQTRRNSADFDKLLSLLKSMDLSSNNKSPENERKVLDEKFEVSEQSEEKTHGNDNYPVYENKVILEANGSIGEGQHRTYKPVLYSSSVSLYINAEDKMDTQKVRSAKTESGSDGDKEQQEATTKEKYTNNRSSSQMSFRGVSKEIEDLQLSIQKAKEMRMCASKELHLLQELLSIDVIDENTTKEKMSAGVDSNRCEQEAVTRSTDVKHNQALTDLRERSKKEVLEDTAFWKEEIQKVKEETKQAWQSKLDRMEARLLAQEEELRRLQTGDHESPGKADPSCHCRENGRTDSAFEDDEEYARQPPTPIPSTRQECDRLQRRLAEEEQRADQLNLMLNQKLIELNRIQITLSKQTKEMIELEKSYLQLQCRLRKGTSKPVVSRLCSRSSPFAPKNLCPKPSPPASPQPTTNGTT